MTHLLFARSRSSAAAPVALHALGVLLAAPAAALAGPPTAWTFEIVADRGTARGLNEAGQLLGEGDVDLANPGFEGFVWTRTGGVAVLPMQEDFTRVSPRAIDETGLVVGVFAPSGVQNDERAIRFAPGTLEPLVLSNAEFGAATAIDDTGRIYGEAMIPRRGFDFGTLAMPDADPLVGPDVAVTVRGAAGDVALGAVEGAAAIIRADDTFDLLEDPGDLGGLFATTVAVDRTASGITVGNVTAQFPSSVVRRPLRWNVRGEVEVLEGIAPTFSQVEVSDVTDDGTIVGTSVSLSSGTSLATIWIDGVPHDLNDFVDTPSNIVLIDAEAMNEAGTIAGTFVDTTLPIGSASGVFVLTPVAAPCPTDLDGDGRTGFADLLQVLEAFDDAGGPADLDGDGTVGFGDVLALIAAWGPCPA